MIVETSRPAELFDRRGEDEGAREALVKHYLPLARRLARRYLHAGQPIDDLVQVASLGLVKAIDRFDPARGVSFTSYAVPTILGELKRYHRDRGWSVRVPRRLQETGLVVRDAIPELAQKLGRSPAISEVASYSGLSEGEVLQALDAQRAYSSISLDAPVNAAGTAPVTLAETITGGSDELERAGEWADCLPHLRRLPDRERRLIGLRFFRDRTQSEIGAELGISQLRVSRLLSQTLRNLREAIGVA